MLNYSDSTKYLGRKLTFDEHHAAEIDNRIATAWRKFNALRDELTNKHYSLRARIQLFNSTITPTVLYGCVCWTTTKTLATKLLRAQRRMLRLIIGTTRRRTSTTNNDAARTTTIDHDHKDDPLNAPQSTALEPWPKYIKRATRIAEQRLAALDIETWTTTLLRRKWRWASRVAAYPHHRCTRLAIE